MAMLVTTLQAGSGSTAIPEVPEATMTVQLEHTEAQRLVVLDNASKPQRTSILLPMDGQTSVPLPRIERSSIVPQGQSQWRLRSLVKNHPALTDKTRHLIERFWSIVLSKALQSGLAVTGAVDVEESSEEKASQAVLRVYIEASAIQAFAFWDGLEIELDRWMNRLDRMNRQILIRDIGLRMHWNVD